MADRKTLPFPISETRSSTYSATYDPLCGQEYEISGEDGYTQVVRLVRCNDTIADPEGRVVIQSSPAGTTLAARNDVEMAATQDETGVYGVIPESLTTDIADNDYFFVVVWGDNVAVKCSNEATNTIATGDYARVDTEDSSTDSGVCYGHATFLKGASIGRYISGTHSDGGLVYVKIVDKLLGADQGG